MKIKALNYHLSEIKLMSLFCSDKKLKKELKNCKYLFGGIVLHSCRSVALLENTGWHAVAQATVHHIQKFMKHFYLIP